jgi:MFS family permease
MKRLEYKHYALTLLMIIYAANYLDRQALGLLSQDIKLELGLSDTQLGLLTGIAFALFYAVMGIPMARWADRGNRVTIIALTTGLWTIGVAACGLAGNFLQLLLIRVGVAVGEAGAMPPANSLIPDYFNRTERPRAVAFYLLGSPISIVIGYFGAGWISELYGWRVAFLVLAAPGVILAPLALLTLKEPRTRKVRDSAIPAPATASDQAMPDVLDVFKTLWALRSFRHLLLAFSIIWFFGMGIVQWQPAFFIRSHGIGTGELGMWFALIVGVGGMVGTYLGGELATRFAPDDEARQLQWLAIMLAAYGLVSVAIYIAPDKHLALAIMAVAVFGNAMTAGPLFAVIQTLVSERMRAQAFAIIFFAANLIGFGFGPLLTGVLSDFLRAALGEESLRAALIVVSPGYCWATWHLWQASKSVARDIDATHGSNRTRPDMYAPEDSGLGSGHD